MKIRNGFVSNSSSSSFILELHEHSKPCKFCHRKDPDFADMVEIHSHQNDDNRMKHYDKKGVLEDLNENIHKLENELHDASLRKQDELMWPRFQCSTQTVQEYTEKCLTPNLNELRALRLKVEQATGTIIECRISYHDDILRDTIESMEKGKRLTVLLKENE